jgi:methyltransferase (TIGR00027 family)
MQPSRYSRTALAMAFFRALETARPAATRVLEDRFALTVLPPVLRRIVRLSRLPPAGAMVAALVDRRWPGARTSGIARTRLIDDWVTAAISDGARQAVFLGAGFDSRAWRLPALAGLPVFEVDHPATSAAKRQRLLAAGLDPARVVQVAIDFDREPLAETLLRHGFDGRLRTAVVWEGVTNYLTADAVDAVLGWAGSLAPGSRLAFTYIHAGVLAHPESFEGATRMLAAVARQGEAWTYGIDPAGLEGRLAAHGLALTEDLGAQQYRARCWPQARPRWRGYAFYRAALAAVPARAAA